MPGCAASRTARTTPADRGSWELPAQKQACRPGHCQDCIKSTHLLVLQSVDGARGAVMAHGSAARQSRTARGGACSAAARCAVLVLRKPAA